MFYCNVLNIYEPVTTQRKIYTKQTFFFVFLSYSFIGLKGLVVS